ncbi:DUF4252 domain-containing protein [Chitinophaga sancti]|uniref:DUF4252 domain-containing protein n=1 Tax=Chitinophaga sancti TaxID=1004 RepID=UPI003F7B1C63
MKHCLVLSLFVCLFFNTTSTQAQDRLLSQFYNAHRGVAVTFRIGVGRLPMRFISGLIPRDKVADGADAKMIFSKIHKIKLYAMEGYDGPIPAADLLSLKRKLIDKDHFDVLMEVRNKGSVVHILNKGADDNLGNVVMLIQDEKDILIVHLHTSLKVDDINMLIREFNKKPSSSTTSTASL